MPVKEAEKLKGLLDAKKLSYESQVYPDQSTAFAGRCQALVRTAEFFSEQVGAVGK